MNNDFKDKYVNTHQHPSLPASIIRGGYGLREAYDSENLMLGVILAGIGKTNARAQTVAGLVWPHGIREI